MVAPVPRLEISHVIRRVLIDPFQIARPSPLFKPRLSLCCAEIARRHVCVGQNRFVRKILTVGDVIFIDDLYRESVENDLLEFAGHSPRVVGGNQLHLAREIKIEVGDASARAFAGAIIDVSIGADWRQGCEPSRDLNPPYMQVWGLSKPCIGHETVGGLAYFASNCPN